LGCLGSDELRHTLDGSTYFPVCFGPSDAELDLDDTQQEPGHIPRS
jgi:hypothetical protein